MDPLVKNVKRNTKYFSLYMYKYIYMHINIYFLKRHLSSYYMSNILYASETTENKTDQSLFIQFVF